MEKHIFVATALLLVTFAGPVHAATATPAPTDPTDKSTISERLNNEINNLKEKIASRVSELNLVEKRGLVGTVSEVSGNQVTITDLAGKTRFIDVDEITKFASPGNKNFGISDLTKGTKITALGLYNKQSKRLLARFINTTVDPVFVSGTISSVDTKKFQLTVVGRDQKEVKIDNQASTKTSTYTRGAGFTKLGFSKITPGERVFVMGYPDKTDKTLIVADRIVIVSGLATGGNTTLPEQTAVTTAPTVKPAR